MMTQALILLAHGSRDPNWRKPFEGLEQTIQAQVPDRTVALAYMEMAEPGLMQVLTALPEGVTTVEILPLFMATGGHMASDVPRLIHQAREAFPQRQITQHPPVGEQAIVQQAFVTVALGALGLPKQESPV